MKNHRISILLRYFLINHKHLKVPLGVEGIWGNCYLNSGIIFDETERRDINYVNACIRYKSKGFGGGISGGITWYPFWFLSMGADAGMRILISKSLIKVYQDNYNLNNE